MRLQTADTSDYRLLVEKQLRRSNAAIVSQPKTIKHIKLHNDTAKFNSNSPYTKTIERRIALRCSTVDRTPERIVWANVRRENFCRAPPLFKVPP